MLDWEEYRTQICIGLQSAVQVPYVSVAEGDWQPQIANCHDNVDRWVRQKPGIVAVRGWVTVGTDGYSQTFLTHHSVVRDEDGDLLDITPLEDEAIRSTMHFVQHIGADEVFFRCKEHFQPFLACQAMIDRPME